ncbi:MAG: hypothetical protein ACRDKS_02335 [Actinomycetota bacterium]
MTIMEETQALEQPLEEETAEVGKDATKPSLELSKGGLLSMLRCGIAAS